MTEFGWKEIWTEKDGTGSWVLETSFGRYEIFHAIPSLLPEWRFGSMNKMKECETVADCMLEVEKDYEFLLREGMKLLAELQKKKLDNL